MSTLSVLPYFHPTTVVLVDDNIEFLSNLSLQLDANLAYRLFDLPDKALNYLNSTTDSRPLSQRFFATFKDHNNGMPTDPVLRLDLAAIQREVNNTERFAETAVVIVDYAMPQMDGVEFCERIDNPHIKKVLFTGAADEAIAIRAFNRGLIDRFIRKSERDVYEQVNTTIKQLQSAYIRDTAHTISHALSLRNRDYCMDPVVADFFNRLCSQHGFVEYYMSTESSGFLVLDADGYCARLIVLTDAELALHREVAEAHDAPQELLDALASGDRVPYFDTTADGFFHPQCTHWRDCLHPAQTLTGRTPYYWALIPAPTDTSLAAVASYNSYLDWLDSISYALF